MNRRDVLKTSALGLGMVATYGLPSWLKTASAATDAFPNFNPQQCFTPWSSNTPKFSWTKNSPPYKIAVSNSYIGNTWRTQMINLVTQASQTRPMSHYLSKFSTSSAGNSVSDQIAQINQMILAGYDAILIDAANSTGLNSVIDKAAKNGILVIAFDNVVTTDKAIVLTQNQQEMGRAWANFLVEQIDGKGTVLMVRGVSGTYDDNERAKGGLSVFKHHPSIKIVQVYGKWDDGVAQKVTADALASQSSIDAVWCEGGDTGVVRAFLQANKKVPPVAGEAENGFRKLAAKLKFPMLSIGDQPSIGALALEAAIYALQGHKLPQKVAVPLIHVKTDDLKPGVNYYPDKSDSLFADVNIESCGLRFSTLGAGGQS